MELIPNDNVTERNLIDIIPHRSVMHGRWRTVSVGEPSHFSCTSTDRVSVFVLFLLVSNFRFRNRTRPDRYLDQVHPSTVPYLGNRL